MSVFPDLTRYDRFGVDTETTGTSFRDRPVGLSVAGPDGMKRYLRWGHKGGGNNCTLAEVITWARDPRGFSDPSKIAVYHNAGFDLRMQAYVGIPQPRRVEDTNVIAALVNELEPSFALGALGKKYCCREKSDTKLNEWCAATFGGRPTRKAQAGNYWKAPGDVVEEYAEDDPDLTLALYDTLRPRIREEGLEDVYATECQLLPILLHMHLLGVRVDVGKAQAVKKQLQAALVRKREEWASLTGASWDAIRSTKQLAELFRKFELPVWKTEAGNDSITKELLDTIDHPLAQLVRGGRQLEHYADTFIDNYILANVGEDGCIHGEFHSVKNDRYGTVSGRFSSGGALNLQNLPARDEEWAPLIRGLFIPYTTGHRWLKIDYSQIEYRFFAHYAGGAMCDAYNVNPHVDFHQMVSDMTGIRRKLAKNINFAKLYGAGVKKLAEQMGCSLADARAMVLQYDQRIPQAKELYDRASRVAFKRGYIITWDGRKRRFQPLPNGQGHMRTHIGLNALLQGSAAGLIKKAMVDVYNAIDHDDTMMHLTVHDELDMSNKSDRYVATCKDIMESYKIRVPIIAEAEVGPDWGACDAWKRAA